MKHAFTRKTVLLFSLLLSLFIKFQKVFGIVIKNAYLNIRVYIVSYFTVESFGNRQNLYRMNTSFLLLLLSFRKLVSYILLITELCFYDIYICVKYCY